MEAPPSPQRAVTPPSAAGTRARVGVIGLGQIGRGVAATLARRGHPLAVFDVRADAAAGLAGVPACSGSAKQVAEAAAMIFLCVVDAEQLHDVLAGPMGVFASQRHDTVLIVMSTIALDDLEKLRELATRHRMNVLDAGVTGGPAAAMSGNLVVFLGGEESIVQAALPVVQDSCGTVVHAGGPGTGMAAKIARNVVSYGCFRAAYEGALLAERSGVDLRQFALAIRASDQQSGGYTLFVDRRGTVEPIEIEPMGEGTASNSAVIESARHLARLAAKDLSAAAGLATELGLELPLAAVTALRFPEVLGLPVQAQAPAKSSDPAS